MFCSRNYEIHILINVISDKNAVVPVLWYLKPPSESNLHHLNTLALLTFFVVFYCLCRCEISKNLCCRNLAVEKAVSELPTECTFCLKQFPRSSLERHKKEECQDRYAPHRHTHTHKLVDPLKIYCFPQGKKSAKLLLPSYYKDEKVSQCTSVFPQMCQNYQIIV